MERGIFFSLLLFFLSFCTSEAIAQNKVKEAGIGLVNLNSFSLQYRWGSDSWLKRISGSINLNSSNEKGFFTNEYVNLEGGSKINTKSEYPLNMNIGVSFGLLKCKNINAKLGWFWGPQLSFGYVNQKSINTYEENSTSPGSSTSYLITSKSERKSSFFIPGFNLNVGAFYNLSPELRIYAEAQPGCDYQLGTLEEFSEWTTTPEGQSSTFVKSSNTRDVNTFILKGFSNSNILLTIVYRWNQVM